VAILWKEKKMSETPAQLSPFDQVIARLAVLESICGATIRLYLANARNDPKFEKANAMVAALRQDILNGIGHLAGPVRAEPAMYMESVIRQVTSHLPALRGAGARQSH
jgi:hypothetical protein